MKPAPRVLVPWAILAAGGAGILLATLHPGPDITTGAWNWSLASGDAALAELLQNLILFIPFGIGLALCGLSLPRAIAIGALLSFSIEFAQQWIPGRDPSIADILCNTISTGIGAGLVTLAPRWLTVSTERSGRQALGAAGLAILVWFGTAAALRPTFPPPPYRVEPRPDFHFWQIYQGEVLEAKLQDGMLYAKATFPDQPPDRRSPLAVLLDAHGHRATVLGVNGRDLTMRYYMPALKLTLEQPDLRWEHALAKVAPADTFMATTGRDKGQLCMAVIPEWRCDLGYTIGDGWKLIYYPDHWPGWLLAIINACWVAGWTIGVGYWAGRTSQKDAEGGRRTPEEAEGGRRTPEDAEGRRRAAMVAKIAVAIVLLGMIVVPMTTHLKGSPLIEWIGALLGIELGLVVGSSPPSGVLRRPPAPLG